MKSKRVKILIFYRGYHDVPNASTIKEKYNTTIIIEESYLLELLPRLIKEDIERIMVEEYDK